MKNIWTTCFILHNMTLRDQQMSNAEFLADEERRNQIVGEESIFENTSESALATSDPEDEGDKVSNSDSDPEDLDPATKTKGVDKDATDDEVDYEEGIDRGFRSVRTRKQGRDFNGVMAAIKQMENKSETIVLREKLMAHIWTLPRKTRK